MPYSSKAVANQFLKLAKESGITLTPMKLQKLIYYAHGWHLAITGKPLIKEEVQAWKFGPVIPEIYHEFKEFGNEPITKLATTLRVSDGKFERIAPCISEEDTGTQDIIRRVWEVYSPYSAIQLSNATHTDGSPWQKTLELAAAKGKESAGIPDELIEKFFKAKQKRE